MQYIHGMVDPSALKLMRPKSESNANFSVASLVLFAFAFAFAVSSGILFTEAVYHITYQLQNLFRWSCSLTILLCGLIGIARALTRIAHDVDPSVLCYFRDSGPVGFIVLPVFTVVDHEQRHRARSRIGNCLLLTNKIVQVVAVQPGEAPLKPLKGFSYDDLLRV
jgi:hypothetical protein